MKPKLASKLAVETEERFPVTAVIEVYGFFRDGPGQCKISDVLEKIIEALKKVESEQNGRLLIHDVAVGLIPSTFYANWRNERFGYIVIRGGDSDFADEIMYALLKDGVTIAENTFWNNKKISLSKSF
jgi:hypothetical protein